MTRINKYLSQCGITSRRGAEKLIAEGHVKVNDELIDHPGTVIDDENDVVKVDDEIVKPAKKKYYILFNKPRSVLTSLSDPYKRKTVAYFVRKLSARVYPIGRLDFDTEGVLIMTNDGDLAYRLSHPKYQVKRIYQATVGGTFTSNEVAKIAAGIELEDGHIGVGKARILSAGMDYSKVEIELTEGHKREVKQLLKAVNNPVKRLWRIEFAGLKVDDLKVGRWRHLRSAEVKHLKSLVEID